MDKKIELASQKFDHCQGYEEVLVKEFHEKLRQDREQWGNKIAKLESEIQQENHRNNEERTTLCSEIDVQFYIVLKETSLIFPFMQL